MHHYAHRQTLPAESLDAGAHTRFGHRLGDFSVLPDEAALVQCKAEGSSPIQRDEESLGSKIMTGAGKFAQNTLSGMDVLSAGLGENHGFGEPLGGLPEVISGLTDTKEGGTGALEGGGKMKKVGDLSSIVGGLAGAVDAAPKAMTALETAASYLSYIPGAKMLGNFAGSIYNSLPSLSSLPGASMLPTSIPGAAMIAEYLPGLQTISSGAKAVSGFAEGWNKSRPSSDAKALIDKMVKPSAKKAAEILYNESYFQWAWAYGKSAAGAAELITGVFGGPFVKYATSLASKIYDSGMVGWVVNKAGKNPDKGKSGREAELIALASKFVAPTGSEAASIEDEIVPLYKMATQLGLTDVTSAIDAEFEKHPATGKKSCYRRFKRLTA